MTPPFGFFSSVFFFSKKSYFLQWFYTEGKNKLKKKSYIPLSAPFHCPASRKLNDCLKTKEERRGGGCFCRAWFPLLCLGCRPPPRDPRDPRVMVPERRVWSLPRPPPQVSPWEGEGEPRSCCTRQQRLRCPPCPCPHPCPLPGVSPASQELAALALHALSLDKRWEGGGAR